MVALKTGDIARALDRPDPRWRVWLIYGPDAGLVSERIGLLTQRALKDGGDDPFRLVRLDGDEIAADPMRLVDEANTIGLFGGERLIRVSRTGKPLAPAIELLLKAPPESSIIAIEAGEMTPKNPLRALCERASQAVALPCYADEGRGLGELVDTTLRGAGVAIERDAREALIASLGSDRLLSRQELDKLVTYVGEARRIALADVDLMVGDSAVREVDAVADAIFNGRPAQAETAWLKLRQEGLDPGFIAGALIRHALLLLQLRLKIEAGQARSAVVEALRMPFGRKKSIEAALAFWPAAALAEAVAALGRSQAEARKSTALSAEIVQRGLIALARRSASLARTSGAPDNR